MSQVLFTSARAVDFDYNVSLPAKLEEMPELADLGKLDRIALKPKGHGWRSEGGGDPHPCTRR